MSQTDRQRGRGRGREKSSQTVRRIQTGSGMKNEVNGKGPKNENKLT